MSLNKNKILFYFFFFSFFISYSQEKVQDTTNMQSLEEVVLTGQLNPQSVEKSVFEVEVISRRDIEQQAANNLADLLNQTLNINIIPNSSTGKSEISMFGLDGQYVKVLVDNIPIVNEEGMGNNTDLTQINLDDIERIEIVEGAMGVQYGSNAVAGVINIITKKASYYKWEVDIYAQEETVGGEYDAFDGGRHIQSAKLGSNINDHWFASLGHTRNDFSGYKGDKQGEYYYLSDSLGGYEWLPKLQNSTKALLSFKSDVINTFYKFEYFNEDIYKYDESPDLNENPATGTINPSSLDEVYTNSRFYHHLNAVGTINNKVNYNVSVSYQQQTKDLERYTYRIFTEVKENVEKGEYLSRSAFFSRGTLSNLIDTRKINLQAGYEVDFVSGEGSPYAISIDPGIELVKNQLDTYGVFASSEIYLSKRLSFMPGTRVSFSSLFDNQYDASLSSKYNFKKEWELRAVLGTANRTPNYEELFTYFVDVNHNVQGNPDLDPERGLSAFLHLKKKFNFKDKNWRLNNKISFSYLAVQDRIELTVETLSPLAYKYNNIDRYKSIGAFTENSLSYKTLRAQLGIGVLGISKTLDSNNNPKDDFLYNLQLNANISYTIPKTLTVLAVYFKHVGEERQFLESTNEDGEQVYVQGTTNAYNWMDASVKQPFIKNKLLVTLGFRNLMDITRVATTSSTGGTHNNGQPSIMRGYGRSFFLKLAYNLNI
ncbi:TonB-dependent receptor plug domain-containing protein [Mangrovimonas aestuarii]|uniref:TonB-dependent receptor plug domain-containing protein n=1 Tax=Mangrovimonas aestuarii TaxID=3018443 RepID=UPI002378910F|nr:TonB-dependent receptor [Mangrovimonas aestuarii]